MVENSLVVSGHGLPRQKLKDWFNDNVCEVARCRHMSLLNEVDDTFLVELFLENELEIGSSRYEKAFPEGKVRPAVAADMEVDASASSEEDAEEPLKQTLDLTLGPDINGEDVPVSLSVWPGSGGGTGAKLWSGGSLLAEWLLRNSTVQELMEGADVIELGAGAAALPSIVAARFGARKVVATDILQSIVSLMKGNLRRNVLNSDIVEGIVLDWLPAGRKNYKESQKFDVVMFADGIYTERGALLLADAATSLLRDSGTLIGALPDLRAGISSFESDLRIRGFAATKINISDELLKAASRPHLHKNAANLVAGGSLEGYRLVMWKKATEEEQMKMRRPKRGKDRSGKRALSHTGPEEKASKTGQDGIGA
eukprot:TRINITY_DN6203_c0_g1_i1.p1 TRINITY_DN6203_c0_g1~~TRINITY_DN6203_c0_g1_i1.p1  ORF type:complete len:369 (+),score=89.31 TRINITY_DN6203_c0_g1_i1:96-1202(+)